MPGFVLTVVCLLLVFCAPVAWLSWDCRRVRLRRERGEVPDCVNPQFKPVRRRTPVEELVVARQRVAENAERVAENAERVAEEADRIVADAFEQVAGLYDEPSQPAQN